MNSKFYTYDSESLILPQSIEDWLPEGHLAKFIVSIVDQLDLSELEKMYSAKGGKAYPVQLMLALIFYAYITGTYSSRKIEKATYDSIAYRYITLNSFPDHDTIAEFRKKFSGKLEGVFLQILMLYRALSQIDTFKKQKTC